MISVVIRAHSARNTQARDLAAQLGAEIVWDRHEDEVETGLRCLQAHNPAASHHLVVEDDAVVAPELLPAVRQILTRIGPDRPLSLYCGTGRPYAGLVAARVALARSRGAHLFEMPGPWWGVAVAYPTSHLAGLAAWYQKSTVRGYDLRVAAWYHKTRRKIIYTLPSLVDHADDVSLINAHMGPRRAHWFVGASATSIAWAESQIDTGRAQQPVAYRNLRTGSRRTVPPGSAAEAALDALDHWQRLEEDL